MNDIEQINIIKKYFHELDTKIEWPETIESLGNMFSRLPNVTVREILRLIEKIEDSIPVSSEGSVLAPPLEQFEDEATKQPLFRQIKV